MFNSFDIVYPLWHIGLPLAVIGVAPLLFLCWKQAQYIKKHYVGKKLAVELYLPLAALLVPAVAEIIADIHGGTAYGTPSDFTKMVFNLFGAIVISGCISLIFIYWFIFSNMILIKNEGLTNGFRVLRWIMYIIAWLLIVVVSYFTYVVEYSSHDPSTE
jgi:hypothetical protein